MKTLKCIGIIILILLPFSAFLSNLSPTWIPEATFKTILTLWFLFVVMSLVLGIFISTKERLFSAFGVLLFIGMLIFANVVFGIGALYFFSKYLKEIQILQRK